MEYHYQKKMYTALKVQLLVGAHDRLRGFSKQSTVTIPLVDFHFNIL